MIGLDALDELVNKFADEMKRKLLAKYNEGRSGWDDERWTPGEIRSALLEHAVKGDPVDVANFCAFLWNRQ
jgi:hypothetical protein